MKKYISAKKWAVTKIELKYHILCKNGSEGCYDLPQEKSLCPSCEYEEDLN